VRELVAEIEIAAPAERVWESRTDFAAYRQWNPLVPRLDGGVRVGARLRARLVVAGAPTLRPRLCVTRVDPTGDLDPNSSVFQHAQTACQSLDEGFNLIGSGGSG
jgi:hypothetical protein